MYAVGGFDFPTTTGSHAVVTGLLFEPVAVIMFGSNFSTVGTLMTGQTGPGLFISVNAYDYSASTTIRSLCLSPNGNSDASRANFRGYENGPISMQTNATGAGTVDYRADSITFDSGGFTMNVTTAAGSRRPIHYVAFGGDMSEIDPTQLVSSAVKQVMTGAGPTFANSYNPRTSLVVSTIAVNGFNEGNVNGSCFFSFGTGHWPGYDEGNVDTWQSSTTFCEIQFGGSLGLEGDVGQFVWSPIGSDPSGLNTSTEEHSGVVTGLLQGFRRHRPYVEGAGLSTMINEGGSAGTPWEYALWWNGEGWTDNVGNIVTTQTIDHPFNFQEFEAVIFSTCNGATQSGLSTQQRFGFGVLGPTYQGCVVFDNDGSCYQSVTRAAATCSASGANTASGTINGSKFTLTQEEGGDVGGIIYHAFGNTIRRFIPQIYRRVFR